MDQEPKDADTNGRNRISAWNSSKHHPSPSAAAGDPNTRLAAQLSESAGSALLWKPEQSLASPALNEYLTAPRWATPHFSGVFQQPGHTLSNSCPAREALRPSECPLCAGAAQIPESHGGCPCSNAAEGGSSGSAAPRHRGNVTQPAALAGNKGVNNSCLSACSRWENSREAASSKAARGP